MNIKSQPEDTNCVFLPNTICPVRVSMKKRLDIQKQLSKYIKPEGDQELMKMYAPMFEKLEELLASEYGFLHNYCAVCPILEAQFPRSE